MKLTLHSWFALGTIAAAFVTSLLLYPALPEQMATHWNFRGEADGYSQKAFGAFFLPAIAVALWLITLVRARFAPSAYDTASFADVRAALVAYAVGFLALLGVAVDLHAIGWEFSMLDVLAAGVGLLFAFTGNLLGKTRKNFLFGVRNPWTLADDEVWARANRFGGRVLVAGGVAILVGAAAGAAGWTLVATVAAIIVLPWVYSFVTYRRLRPPPSAAARGGL